MLLSSWWSCLGAALLSLLLWLGAAAIAFGTCIGVVLVVGSLFGMGLAKLAWSWLAVHPITALPQCAAPSYTHYQQQQSQCNTTCNTGTTTWTATNPSGKPLSDN
ncbi:hypothetical protein EDB85DRAFT_1888115 [Lactarius pseudohatsudake]|nr:hypothetical protein EDB85DRAFT_1888115 [Lactarius pseudohatsudake]